MTIRTIGLDLAKSVFQAHGVDETGATMLTKRLHRKQMLPFFSKLPPCLIGMEACGTAHHWARTLAAMGHEVRLIPPSYVKAYRQARQERCARAVSEPIELARDSQIGGILIQPLGWRRRPAGMAEPLSIDLRERVVAAVKGGMSRRRAAAHFRVGVSSAIRWAAQVETTGDLSPKPHGRRSSIGGDRGSGRHDPVAFGRAPDTTLTGAARGAGRERASLQRVDDLAVLRPAEDHAQKKSAHAAEQERPDILKRREAWFDGQLDLDPAKLVFIDETWASTNMARRHGRAPARRATARRRSAWPLEDDDLRRRPSARRPRRPVRSRRSDQRHGLRGLCRAVPRADAADRATSSSWTTSPATRGRRCAPSSKPQARACSTFRPTAPTSIQSRSCSPSSRPCCERPPSEPSTASGASSANASIASPRANAQTISKPQDTSQPERKPL